MARLSHPAEPEKQMDSIEIEKKKENRRLLKYDRPDSLNM